MSVKLKLYPAQASLAIEGLEGETTMRKIEMCAESIRALIEWQSELLDEWQRVLLEQLKDEDDKQDEFLEACKRAG